MAGAFELIDRSSRFEHRSAGVQIKERNMMAL